MHEIFYARARKYAENDEMKGHGESMITVAHCQTWSLLGSYEFKMMYFPRAWMSVGRATRSAQMMGLHRQDGAGLDVKQCLSPAKDWVERVSFNRSFYLLDLRFDTFVSTTVWGLCVESDGKDAETDMALQEERRRTFWIAFCQDRYASIGTGWPMTIDEKDVSFSAPLKDDGYRLTAYRF
jgi:hypothetical protein